MEVSFTFVLAWSRLILNGFLSNLCCKSIQCVGSLEACDNIAEKCHAEQCWCQHTLLLNSISNWKSFGGLAVVQNSGCHSIRNWRTILVNLEGQPYFSMIFHSPSRHTVSNAFVRSMNVV